MMDLLQNKGGEILAGIALAIIAVWLGSQLLDSLTHPAYDLKTLCRGEPKKQVVLLIDPSTRFTKGQRYKLAKLQNYLLQGGLPVNAKFSVYRLQEQVAQPPMPEIQACFPGSAKASSGVIQRRMAVKFQAMFKTAFAPIVKAKPEKSSPIIEGLVALSSSDDWKPGQSDIYLFGDLLQHSSLLSQYGWKKASSGYWQFAKAHAAYLKEHPVNLKDAKVYIFLLDNAPLNNQVRVERHRRFWRDFLRQTGQAESVQFCALDKNGSRHCQK
jgi:hypothetical protein